MFRTLRVLSFFRGSTFAQPSSPYFWFHRLCLAYVIWNIECSLDRPCNYLCVVSYVKQGCMQVCGTYALLNAKWRFSWILDLALMKVAFPVRDQWTWWYFIICSYHNTNEHNFRCKKHKLDINHVSCPKFCAFVHHFLPLSTSAMLIHQVFLDP